jgi:Coenzyme PQQ synthesis protein D (PqqD)
LFGRHGEFQMVDDSPGNELPSIDDATMISRHKSVLSAEVGAETAMMSLDDDRLFGLDDIGGDIWRRLEVPRRFGDLIDELAMSYDADRVLIAEEVRALLAEMATHQVVTLG